jgi:lysophospholipase L1-like esterase
MAIGDSLYNGFRSLTINANLAAHSVPAQVAQAFGWDFVSPDYPHTMLLDVEGIFRNPSEVTQDLVKQAAINAHVWLAEQRWSASPFFHNLSIGQQQVADLYTANYQASLSTVNNLAAQGATLPLAQVPALLQALNTAFVLNPGRVANDTRTSIAILGEQKPKRVLINIGVNDGLWTLLLLANPTNFTTTYNPIPNMKTLALHLKELCPDTERFYINLQPKPSSIANLMPPWLGGGDPPIPRDGYYDKYIGQLIGSGGITKAQMQAIDTWINTTLNPQIRDAFSPLGDRARFVDIYASTAAYDRKNMTATKQVFVHKGATEILLDNAALEVTPWGGMAGWGGGMFGLDNLHPTIVGYGIIAQAVCDVIAATENLPPRVIDLQACYDADTLLHDLPPTVALTDFLLQFVGAFISGTSLAATA